MAFDFEGRRERFRARLRRDPANPPRRWLRRHWPYLVALGVAATGVGVMDAWLATCGFAGCPSRGEIRNFRPQEGGKIVDRNGKFLGRLANIRRVNVPLGEVPKHVQEAFIATEDRRFFDHNGLDWRGFARAAVRNVAAGGVREGFSTITMQVARNAFLQRRYNGRSLRRKLIELRLTRLIESELTKPAILELYLNVIYLGNGMNGVEAASRDIFGKSVSKLTLAEGATLAALPKAPSRYNPRVSTKRALERRAIVLSLMQQQGYIDEGERSRAANSKLRVAADEWRPSTRNELLALDIVRAMVDSALPDVLKEEGDVVVHTTLDREAQLAADRAILRHGQSISRAVGGAIQGALVALDPATGDLRAVVGGRQPLRRGFNRAFSAKRQPGSAFKPFVYAAALAGGLGEGTPVDDEPIEMDIDGRIWRPANYGDEYSGRVTFRQALEKSANAATIRVSQAVGPGRVIEAAHRNGIRSQLPNVPSIALGAAEVTPLELVTAYAPFANGGMRVKPRLITSIEAPDGTVLWASEVERTAVMDPRDAYELTSMLRAVVDYGTGHVVRDYGIKGPVAGKTGTTNNGTDVWFVGYTPTLVAGIWFGYDQPRSMGAASGGRLAAPAWADFYRYGWKEDRTSQWLPPDGMIMRVIDPESGQLATEYCPTRTREFFKPGREPNAPCELHTYTEPEVWAEAGEVEQGPPPQVRREVDNIRKQIGRALGRIFRF
ncbi:MAG TPA: PBP1A family penicillin-binding protein [Gemmatimonadaceae bacterium]